MADDNVLAVPLGVHQHERQTWPADLRDWHLALRAAVADAATAVRHHPTMQQALREGCHPVTEQALKDAARAGAEA